MNRLISHTLRLRDTAEPLGSFLSHATVLGTKLGPLPVQLPPNFQLDLPPPSQLATPAVYDALGRRGVALCVPVGGGVQPDLVTTAPFTYLRRHAGIGPAGGFADEQLRPWAARVRALVRSGKDVRVYSTNDREGHAVRDALRLRERLRLAR